jgi:hypothetical protein
MKRIVFLFIIFIISGVGFSQDIVKVAKAKDEIAGLPSDTVKHWFINGTGSLAFSQAAFSNWAAGGQNSIGLNASVNLKANYRNGKHAWGNTIGLGYGFNIQGKGDNAEFNKTNDRIELTSAYGYDIVKDNKWLLTVLLNFRTQFSQGYNYPRTADDSQISNFMAPGYLIAGLGITYAPVKWFYLYMSPTSGRFTFVLDTTLANQGAFGVKVEEKDGKMVGEKWKGEFGPYIRADMNRDFSKSVNLATTLELFTNYMEDFGNIDVNWYMQLNLKVNKWLATSLTMQLIYDNDVTLIKEQGPDGPGTQFKEILGVGLTYSFN